MLPKQQQQQSNELFVKQHVSCYEKSRFKNFESWIIHVPVHFVDIYCVGSNPRELNIITKPTIFDCSIVNSTNIHIESKTKTIKLIIPLNGNEILSLDKVYQHLNKYLTSHKFGIIVINESYMLSKYKKVVDILEKSIIEKQNYFCFISPLDLIQSVLEFSQINVKSDVVIDGINSYQLNCQIECCGYHKTNNKPSECCVVKNYLYSSAFQKSLIHFNVKLQNQDKLVGLKQQTFSPINHTYLLFDFTSTGEEIVEIGCLLIKQSNNENNGEYIKLEGPCVLACETTNQPQVEGIHTYPIDTVINYFIDHYIKKENYDFIIFSNKKLQNKFNKYFDFFNNNTRLLTHFYSSIVSFKLNSLPLSTNKQQHFVIQKQPPNTYVCILHTSYRESCLFYKIESVFTIWNWFLTKTEEIQTECPFEFKTALVVQPTVEVIIPINPIQQSIPNVILTNNPIQQPIPKKVLPNLRIQQNSHIAELINGKTQYCEICYQKQLQLKRLTCDHIICDDCLSMSLKSNIKQCPFCEIAMDYEKK